MNENGWMQYAPPGMAYSNNGNAIPQSNYYIPSECCQYPQYPVMMTKPKKKKNKDEKIIAQTALCCTIAVIAGVAIGAAVGYSTGKKKHRDEESTLSSFKI